MKTQIGSCEFPSAKVGLARKYVLPERFANEEEFRKLLLDRRNYFFWGKQVSELNPELPYPQSRKDARSVSHGAASRFLPEDIRYFVRIGGGSNRSEIEKDMLRCLRKNLSVPIGWIPSPSTILRIGRERLSPETFHRKLVPKVRKAVVDRFKRSSQKK